LAQILICIISKTENNRYIVAKNKQQHKKGGVIMAIVRWSPFRGMVSLQDGMNSIFDEFFGRVPSRVEPEEGAWSPSVDISENNNAITINAEIPGMSKEDIKINIQDNTMTLKGEKKQEKEEKDANYHRVERSYGAFMRSFTLPTPVQADKVKASYKNGVLRIVLPKSEEVKPKEIPIEVN
jgi:HSP20 family protein